MAGVKSYYRRLLKLQKDTAISFNRLELSDTAITVNEIVFQAISKSNLYKNELRGKGILVSDLNLEDQRFCEAKRISYFTLKNKLRLFQKKLSLTIEPNKRIVLKRQEPIITVSILPSYTALISPNGFKILDALFRLPPSELKNYSSALSFANQYDLNQPKLSKIMRLLKVSTVYEARAAIANLPDVWWKQALSAKGTTKRLTKFFPASKPHYSLLRLSSKEIFEEMQQWSQRQHLVPGPLELAKGLGFLRDEDISIWGTREGLHNLKTRFKLIPGIDKERPIWQLATPKYGEIPEALITNMDIHNSIRANAPFPYRQNLFRAIWDLGFGTERLKELQISILREILNEV